MKQLYGSTHATFYRRYTWRFLFALLLLLPLMGWGQTVIATQDFETSPATPTASVSLNGGTLRTGTLASPGVPTNAPYGVGGTQGYTVTNGTATVTSSSDINIVNYTDVTVSFRLAGYSVNAGNGIDIGDNATLEISTDGGSTWTRQIQVAGSAVNRTWTYSATGTGTTVYNAARATPAAVASASGATGVSMVSVTGINPTAANTLLRFRITLINNDANERWAVDDISVTGTAVANPTPAFTITPGTLANFTYLAGSGPSASKSFSVEGRNLTSGAITITAPTNYEVSADDATFGATVSIANSVGGTLAATPVYVRLKAGLAAGNYNGETVTIDGGGAMATVTVSGMVTAVPELTVTPGSLSGFSTTEGAASVSQTYLLKGTDLTSGVTVTAPGGYEVAQATPGSYGTSLTVSQANATTGRTIYVRLAASATPGTYGTASSPLLVTNAATNAATKNVTVDGTVTAQVPAIRATPGSLNGFTTQVGTASATQSYQLTPTALSAPITVTAPAGYAVSLAAGGPFTGSVEAPATGNSTVYVRLTGAAVGSFGGVITNVSGSASQDVAVSGEVTPAPVVGQVVISQVYGGGGNSNAPFNADFIELHNVTASPVAISGWSVQYTGSTGATWVVQDIPANTTLAAGAYYLIRASSPGSTGSALPTPDLTTSFAMNSSSAKVALVGNSTALTSGCPTGGVLDFVGYGSSANCFEGSGPTPELSNTTAALRQNGGCLDTDDNATDFAAGAPNPRNSQSAVNICAPQPEINVLQAGVSLPTGSTVAFGNTPVASTNSLVLTIQNRGTAVLNLTGTPVVAVSGTNAADFSIIQPAAASVAAGSSVQFTVQFTPSATGTRSATLSIASNDSDETPYTLAVTGSGTASLAATATGTLLLEDNFNYPAGDDLKTHGWLSQGTGTNTIDLVTGNNALSGYPLGLADTTATRRVKLVPSGDDLHRAFTVPTGAATLYAATTVRVSAATANGDYFLHFLESGDNSTFRGRVFAKSATGGYQMGLSISGLATYASPVFQLNMTYLLILKYEKVAGGDIATLYMLPAASATEPSSGLVSITASDTYPTLNAVGLRQGGSSAATLTLDGVRAATGWGAAVGQPTFSNPAATIAAGSYYSLTLQNNDVLTPTGAVTLEGPLTLTSGLINTDATNSLTLLPTATISTTSTLGSYVNGPLKRIVTPVATPTTFVFPIGKDGKARPAALSVAAQTSTTTYTAELFNQSARSSAVAAPLARVSAFRYTTITPDVQPTGFNGTVTLSFDTDDQVNDPSAPSFVVAKRATSAGPWESIGRSASSGTAASGSFVAGTLTSGSFSSFSDFTMASTDPVLAVNPLPVMLVSFEAVAAQASVRLSWGTAAELNNAGFEVQRSTDGRVFRTVGQVKGRGTTTQGQQYTFLDTNAAGSLLYYRLRQLDTDGTASYSAVRVVNRHVAISLYPNPAHSELTLHLPAAAQGAYHVVNTLGHVVLRGVAQGATSVQVGRLPAGVYQVVVTTAAGRSAHRFIKE